MASLNKVMLLGNLTADPEIKQLPSGMSVGDLRMAVSETFRDKNSKQNETVCYVDVVVWGRQAETVEQYLSKGSPLFVEGRLQLDQWEKDGQKRSKMRVCAERVQFVGAKGEGGKAGKGAGGGDKVDPFMDEEPPF